MIVTPQRPGEELYLSPNEVAVPFFVDMAGGLPEGVGIAAAQVFSVSTRWPGQPDEAAVPITGFAQIGGIAGTVITVLCGDGTQQLGSLVEVLVAVTLDNDPASMVCVWVPLPITKGVLPWR